MDKRSRDKSMGKSVDKVKQMKKGGRPTDMSVSFLEGENQSSSRLENQSKLTSKKVTSTIEGDESRKNDRESELAASEISGATTSRQDGVSRVSQSHRSPEEYDAVPELREPSYDPDDPLKNF